MSSLKFCCPACGGSKFIFTRQSSGKKTHHGAACACCQLPLTRFSCFTAPPVKGDGVKTFKFQ